MAKSDQQFAALRSKLEQFETQLKSMLESTEFDLGVAKQLQRLLMPNRLPEIPGLLCLAKYLPAQQLSAEGFDLIPTQKGREVWIIASWSERFGLSSVLLQALMRLQSQALVHAHPTQSLEEVFNELSISLTQAKKGGEYRLFVARLDLLSLKLTGLSQGMLPLLRRKFERQDRGAWEWVSGDSFMNKPELLEAAHSQAPLLAHDAHAFSFTLEPGSRLYYVSADWARPTRLEEVAKKLKIERSSGKSTLLEDLNHLMIAAEDSLKREKREADIAALAFEVDAKKLHLA